MFCTRCGANNLDTDQFCRSCGGTLVKSGAQSASSGSAQPPYPHSTPSAGQQQQQQQQGYTPYPGYQGYPPPQYGHANQVSGQQGASGRAIASMILSVIAVFTCGPLLSVPGMILGKIEMNAIRQGQAHPAGENFAKAGFYVGLVVTILYSLAILAYILLVIGVATSSIR
jgi:hypothetical protein